MDVDESQFGTGGIKVIFFFFVPMIIPEKTKESQTKKNNPGGASVKP